jgi:DNA-binding beta-propeller fold protein YncE
MKTLLLPLVSLLAATALVLALRSPAQQTDAKPITMGAGAQRYEWVRNWLELPEKKDIGNTHGGIVIDAQGLIYVNTDTTKAIMVYGKDGKFLRSFGEDLAGGVHGMLLAKEDGKEFLYLVHHGKNEARKLTLQGETLWTIPYPAESGKYAKADEYQPTGIALTPNGDIFIADGYGKSWVHRYDKNRKYLASFGGPGSEPGQMNTPHGIALDTRTNPPTLLVADRANHRLQVFDLEGRFQKAIGGFRLPCSVDIQDEYVAVADLAGRVTILNGKNEVVTQLGDNPNEALRAKNDVPREQWVDGLFTAPHSARWDAEGNLYVMDWNYLGRINKLRRVKG